MGDKNPSDRDVPPEGEAGGAPGGAKPPAAEPQAAEPEPGMPEAEGVAPPADPLAIAQARLTELEREKAELKDRMLRVAADFDNFKKRSRKEMGEAGDRGREALLRELLQVIDNLERAVAHAGSNGGGAGLLEGVQLVLRQFATVLEKFDVRSFSAVGEVFDPQWHAAVQQVETDEHPAGTVVSEFQRGYRVGQRLLRPAMVVVAKPKPKEAGPGDGAGDGSEGAGG